MEGRDPPRAAEAWGQVLRARQDVAGPTAEAILSRVAPRFESSQREFARAVTSSPMLLATRNAGSLAVLALLAGRKPTMDILYLAGLSHLAVASSPTADVAEVLTASAREAA